MNPDQLFTHLKKLGAALSAKQLLGLGTVFVAVVGVVVGSAYWLSRPNFTLLVADMDAETASTVLGKLKDGKIPYELGDGGRAVSVPIERADELRLQFASGGLPSAGRIGFEIFDRPAFGTTDFLEHVNYRRALEGELARTIGTLAEVASARVHIAMAKDSLFVDQEQPAKASVVLRLKGSRPLAAGTVKGIANLVASSVEALRPESVVILDSVGRALTRPVEGEGSESVVDLDRQQQIERDLSTRVVALLEPVVGPGRVRVNVAAYLKPETVEETAETFDPTTVVRSRQTSSETSPVSALAGGIAGARANQPPALSTAKAAVPGAPPADPDPAAAPLNAAALPAGATSAPITNAPAPAAAGKTSETTNYEVSRTTRHTITREGQLARLSVAVILDDERVPAKAGDATATVTSKPWEAQGIQRVHGLVAAAVGLDPDRGDQLTVENIAFDVPQTTPEIAGPTVTEQLVDTAKRGWPSAVRGVAIVGIAIVALFGVLRPLARRATGLSAAPALPAPAGGAARLPTVQEMEGQIEAELDASTPGPRRLPVLQKRVAKLASEEPEQLARIVRGWMTEGER